MFKKKSKLLFLFCFLRISIFHVICGVETESEQGANPDDSFLSPVLVYRIRVMDFKGDPVPGAMARIGSFYIGKEIFNLPNLFSHSP